ncbi:MAG: 3-deoxy-8-phosphooctulonate synthase [Nitrospinaceae bacterium]|nr:3-deoxy-8-phosphooctulonate synthase [Nitrospinaceae bacterium]NIS86202.1 3-deoxy-8-phosphooctulonate synthase [Nitrospinaceae bacterium]
MMLSPRSPQPVRIGAVTLGGEHPLALIAGPCVIESERHALETAERLKRVAADAGVPFIYKSSYDKANRSSLDSYRGPGLAAGLKILQKVKETLSVPVLSDVHREEEIGPAAEVLDVLQIPAFLCRQTDLLVRAAQTGKPVNVKKGQFMAPWDMKNVVDKLEKSGGRDLLLTERGFMFGYNNLVVDMRSLVLMREFGHPVVFDATHSLQLPGGQGTRSGGQRELIPDLARGAVAVGCDALFLEVHPDPDRAPSDGPNMLRLSDLPELLDQVKGIDQWVRGKTKPVAPAAGS